MKICHLGHASFLVETNSIRFLLDPWIEGKCFFESWSPLIDIDIENDIKNVDYIWFSHEHPDHFHPASVKKLLNYFKKVDFKVVFQRTIDGKVKKFFKSIYNIDIIELGNSKTLEINDQTSLKINSCGVYDSYIQIKDSEYCFTHLNDCQFYKINQLNFAKKFSYKRKHILSSQFGLAHLPCDFHDDKNINKHIEDKISCFVEQINFLKPDYFIPSSSSVHFCHEENQHMNKTRINPYNLRNKINFGQFLLGDKSIVFDFKKNKTHQDKNLELSNKYEKILKLTEKKILSKNKYIEEQIYLNSIEKKIKKIKKNNNILLMYFFKLLKVCSTNCNFYIKDHKKFINVNIISGEVKFLKNCKNYIIISSDMLNNLYNSDYSVDSLISSGCFNIHNYSINNLNSHLNINTLNQAGIFLNFSLFLNLNFYKKIYDIILQHFSFKFSH